MIGGELEVLAEKFRPYGWHDEARAAFRDRAAADWMDLLGDYPHREVRAACGQWIKAGNARMPTEGQILQLVLSGRRATLPRAMPEPEPEKPTPSAEERRASAAKIAEELGYKLKIHTGDA